MLLTIGGDQNKPHDTIRNLTKIIFADELLMNFTWDGTFEKEQLKTSPIIRICTSVSGETVHGVKNFMSKYLQNATGRYKSSEYSN